jgi:hypothetical protein
MRIEELSYKIIARTLNLLEQKYHYKIPDDHKRDIEQQVMDELATMIPGGSSQSSQKRKKK